MVEAGRVHVAIEEALGHAGGRARPGMTEARVRDASQPGRVDPRGRRRMEAKVAGATALAHGR